MDGIPMVQEQMPVVSPPCSVIPLPLKTWPWFPFEHLPSPLSVLKFWWVWPHCLVPGMGQDSGLTCWSYHSPGHSGLFKNCWMPKVRQMRLNSGILGDTTREDQFFLPFTWCWWTLACSDWQPSWLSLGRGCLRMKPVYREKELRDRKKPSPDDIIWAPGTKDLWSLKLLDQKMFVYTHWS